MNRRRLWVSLSVFVIALVVSSIVILPVAQAQSSIQDWSPDQSDQGWQHFRQVIGIVLSSFVEQPNLQRLWQGAIRGAVDALGDPYSTYLDPSQYQQFRERVLEGKYSGVGVVLERIGDFVTVMSVFPGTPAEQAGIKPGDRIVQVDGEEVVGWPVEAVTPKIRGEPGTKVKLTIRRGVSSTPLEFELVRADIKLEPVETKLLNQQVGYIRLTSFEEGVGSQIAEAVSQFRKNGVTRYILDLRGNPGGLIEEAQRVANVFLPPGPLVKIVGRGGNVVTVQSKGESWDYSMVVLVDGGTASAAEIVAAAIKERGMGKLLGSRTFGKGSVQSLIPLPGGAALKITTARFLSPNGNVIDGNGVEPDVALQPEDDESSQVNPFAWKRPLGVMTIGLDVLSLQENLAFLGLYSGPLDGIYGPLTAQAVRRFQQAKGLAATGKVDADTGALLAEEVRAQLIAKENKDPWLDKAIEFLNANPAGASATSGI